MRVLLGTGGMIVEAAFIVGLYAAYRVVSKAVRKHRHPWPPPRP